MIATGGEGEKGEKVDLKIYLIEELNPSVKGKSTDHHTIRRIVKYLYRYFIKNVM